MRRRYSLPGKRSIRDALQEKKDRFDMEEQMGVSLPAEVEKPAQEGDQ